MPILSISKTYADGTDLFEADLDAIREDVQTFFNTTKIDSANIQDAGIETAKIQDSAISTTKIADSAVTEAKLAAAVQALLVPSGVVQAYAGTTAPTGYLTCDGTAVSRTTFADLFAAVGTIHGEGDGSLTFNLPDYRGRFLRGTDGGAGRDPDAGSRTAATTGGATGDNTGSVQDDKLPSHTHTVPLHNHKWITSGGGADAFGGGGFASATFNSAGSGVGGSAGGDYFTDNQIATEATGPNSTGDDVRPKNANVTYIIKT